MKCPNCDVDMVKSAISDYELRSGCRYLDIVWEAFCPKCDMQCEIEETFRAGECESIRD